MRAKLALCKEAAGAQKVTERQLYAAMLQGVGGGPATTTAATARELKGAQEQQLMDQEDEAEEQITMW